MQNARLALFDFAHRILGRGTHGIADVITEAALEIIEPHPPGVRLDVPWADGLASDPHEVRWYGDAVQYGAAQRTRSASNCMRGCA